MVIAIIAILAAILFPVFAQAREAARKTACLSNIKQIMMGIKMYVQDNDEQHMGPDWYTTGPNFAGNYISWPDQVQPYIKNNGVWLCPSGPKYAGTAGYGGCSYANTITSHYCWAPFVTYDYYGVQSRDNPTASVVSAAEFFGFPSTPAYYNNARPWQETNRSIEMAEFPAETTFILEGYISSFYPYSTQAFGYPCSTGFGSTGNPTAIDLSDRNAFRHNEGMNVGYCDGHAKWIKGSRFYRDNSASAHVLGGVYPQNPATRLGP